MINLTEELARLNGLDVGDYHYVNYCADAITLAIRLHALLVEAEGAFQIYKEHDEIMGGMNNGEAAQMLTKLHAAGIGGKND